MDFISRILVIGPSPYICRCRYIYMYVYVYIYIWESLFVLVKAYSYACTLSVSSTLGSSWANTLLRAVRVERGTWLHRQLAARHGCPGICDLHHIICCKSPPLHYNIQMRCAQIRHRAFFKRLRVLGGGWAWRSPPQGRSPNDMVICVCDLPYWGVLRRRLGSWGSCGGPEGSGGVQGRAGGGPRKVLGGV